MRADNPQISFADLEFMNQGMEMDPVLKQISAYVAQHPEWIEAVDHQLQRGLKKSRTGRRGLTAAQVLLSWILMRIKNWDYRELAERIRDGITLRLFTRFYSHAVPKHDAFSRGHRRLSAELIQSLNQHLVQAAVQDGLEDGEALRGDTTVVETDIHHPTDASLLWDTVRVITRSLQQLRELVPHQLPRYPKRTRAAKRRMQELQRMTASQREHQQVPKYRELIGIAEEALKNGRHAVKSVRSHKTMFGRAPKLYANDRGSYSPDNVKGCEQEGVDCVCIPQRGGKKAAERETLEHTAEFKQGQRFRAGIEGRISVLFRGRGMKRYLASGRRGLELLVGLAVLANNLLRIAALLLEKMKKKMKRRPRPA